MSSASNSTLSPTARAEAALARCGELGVEATKIFLALDRERLRRDAAELETRLAAGESLPLAGMVCSIKDLVDRQGERTTAGSLLLEARTPATEDAEIVKRLEAAGALIMGRTNMSEFAYSGLGLNPHHGTPGAIFDAKRVPGGSSCGAALSVAHGIVDVGIGTDTGGSVRIPAAVNGLYGFKPTADSVPVIGVHPLNQDMDTVGPLGSTLAEVLQVAGVLRGQAFDNASAEKPLLGVPGGPLSVAQEPAVQRAHDDTIDRLRRAGVELVDIDMAWMDELAAANRILIACEASQRYADAFDTLKRVGDPDVLRRMRFADEVSPAQLDDARTVRTQAVERFSDALADAGVTALVSPTLRVVAPTIEAARADFDTCNTAMLANCSQINFVDGCAFSLPLGHREPADGPFPSLMLSAARGADDRLASAALAVDAALAG